MSEREHRPALQAEIDELEQVLRDLPFGLCVLDRDYRYVRVNEELARVNAIPVSEHLGRRVRDLFPEAKRFVEPQLEKVFESGEAILDVPLIGKRPGPPFDEVDTQASFRPVFDSDGRVSAVACTVQDVTQIRTIERSLKESELGYRRILEESSECLAVVGEDGRIQWANQRAIELTGIDLDHGIGLHIRELIHPDSLAGHPERFSRLLREGSQSHEMRLKHADGSPLDIEIVGSKLGDGRLVFSMRDIAERLQREASLRESETRYRVVAENGYGLICEFTRESGVHFVNTALCGVLGYQLEEFMELDWRDVIHPEDQVRAAEIVRKLHNGGQSGEFSARVRHRDGRWIWLQGFGALYQGSDGYPRIIAVARDIHELKRLEDERRNYNEILEAEVGSRTRELQTANAQLRTLQARLLKAQRMSTAEDLAGSVAHSINNPLAALLGTVEMALEDQAGDSKTLDRIHHLGQRIKSVVDSVLQLFRQGALELVKSPPDELLASVRDELRARAHARQVSLQLKSAADLPELRVDRTLLTAALVAIAENGVDAAGSGGSVWLSVDTLPDLAVVRFEIADTGPGIPPVVRKQAFDPFFTTKGAGTGLGLAIARGVIEGHQGKIRIEDRPGGGTLVSVEIAAK